MKRRLLVPLLCAIAVSGCSRAQHPPQHEENRIAVMSPEVLKRRLELQGYGDVQVVSVDTEQVRFRATQAGRRVELEVDRRVGPGRESVPRTVSAPDTSTTRPPYPP
jgi:hypothetical protein